jgi:hypothetical protein
MMAARHEVGDGYACGGAVGAVKPGSVQFVLVGDAV